MPSMTSSVAVVRIHFIGSFPSFPALSLGLVPHRSEHPATTQQPRPAEQFEYEEQWTWGETLQANYIISKSKHYSQHQNWQSSLMMVILFFRISLCLWTRSLTRYQTCQSWHVTTSNTSLPGIKWEAHRTQGADQWKLFYVIIVSTVSH